MVAENAQRVTQNTAPEINERIRRGMEYRIAYFETHPDHIDERLDELDLEWDVERTLQLMSAGITLTGLTLGVLKARPFLAVPFVIQGFFAFHALQGWCPPLPVLRRLGLRTVAEIEEERHALLEIQRTCRACEEVSHAALELGLVRR